MYHRMILAVAVMFCLVISSVAMAQSEGPKVSGYVKSDYSTDMKDESATDVSNARVKISGSLNEKTSYTVFIDGVRDDVLLDAFIKHTIYSTLSVQIGQFKTAYSTDNLISGSKVPFINRPYMKGDVSPAFRDQGIQLAYSHKYLDAYVGMMNGTGQNKNESNSNKSVAVRAVAKVLPELKISGNYYTGENAADMTEDEFINIGANGTIGPFEYSGEFAQKNHGDMTANALFAWVAYDFQTGMDVVQTITPAFRFETSDPDTDTDDDARSRYTFGVTAHFAKKFTDRVMVNYEIREVETGDANDMFGIEYTVIF